MPDAHCVKKVYILKNLGCAHCAAKMEHRIKELPGVEYANISYVTKQLRLSAVNHEAVLPAIKEICTSIESGVEVVPREGEGPFNFKTQVYVLENLGCANCAAKMERAINELPQVSEATITFATKQLKVTARDFDGLLPQMQKICSWRGMTRKNSNGSNPPANCRPEKTPTAERGESWRNRRSPAWNPMTWQPIR